MEIKYNIGDSVWRATWDVSPDYVKCPECGGDGRLRVLLHDDTMVSIECRGCAVGYDLPTGRVKVYRRTPKASRVTVKGFEVGYKEGVEYRTHDSYIIKECDLFPTKDEALARARVKAAEADREERDRVEKKEKDTRTWAWNAHYHRDCIRRAEKEIAYHTAKLNVAKVKAKEKVK